MIQKGQYFHENVNPLVNENKKMPVSNSLKTFYVLIHILFTIFEYSVKTVGIIYQICIKIIHSGSNHSTDEAGQLERRLSNISKKPRHLTIILGIEEYTLNDIANLIFWSLTVDIPYISFYDFKGHLKKQEEKLQQVVYSKKVENVNIIWHSHSRMLHKNGYRGKKIHVKILTEEDGRQNVVNVTKNLALSKEKDISVEKVSEYLLKQYEFSDPDMAIMFGKILHIYNYPPWQLRLTEFFKVNSVSNITFSLFLETLEKYSRCEQRVGT